MISKCRHFILIVFIGAILFVSNISVNAQEKNPAEILPPAAASKIVPMSFYFAGQSAPTQIRNSAVARLGKDRYVVVGMVDTSGYSTEMSDKYEGFFITDSPILIGGKELATGAYGFGFSSSGKIRIFDLSSKEIMSAETMNDKELKRPRPLMMSVSADGVRLYKGRNYAMISAK